MKNTVNVSLSPLASFIINAPSFSSSVQRYNIIKTLANKFHEGDIFISEDVKNDVGYMELGNLVYNMKNCRCPLDVITIVTRCGKKIFDSNGVCLGKTSCNVYKFNWNPDRVKKELSSISSVIESMFN